MKVSTTAKRVRKRFNRLVDELRASPIAIETQAANTQHYEVAGRVFSCASRASI